MFKPKVLMPFTCLLALAAFSVPAMASPANTTHEGESNRLRFSCETAGGGLFRYVLSGVIDWTGNDGEAVLVLMREQDSGTVVLGRFRMDVQLDDTGIEQVIRSAHSNRASDLFITWRTDLPRGVPVVHYLKQAGRKYSFRYCGSEVPSLGSEQ